MSRRSLWPGSLWAGSLGGWALRLLAGLAVVWPGADPAWGADPEGRIRSHLEAGEFGPALAVAQGDAAGARRDQWLQQIATAQAAAGAQRASLSTLGQVGDDRIRSQGLDQIGSQPFRPWPARGGAEMADFDTLIELITTTIDPESWLEAGGPGTIDDFPTGVYVDGAGLLKRVPLDDGGPSLAAVRRQASRSDGNHNVHRPSPLRKVSLPRLEKQMQLRQALGQPPEAAMKALAGIYQLKYVLVYPETGDVVLAGPAGPWQVDRQGRQVHVETGRPVLQLDDLVVALRSALPQDSPFGCSIRPVRENLAAAKAFLEQSAARPLRASQRQNWLRSLRDHMGQQEIVVFGIDPRTRTARVLVEADYHMKLVGMGLEDGTLGVTSYLDMIEVAPGQSPPPLNVLRWWFTLNYKALRTTEPRDAFQLHGQGVQVLSENQLLTERGQRIPTGQSDPLNREFAHAFTKHFPALATKYPVYAELRNIFDLALAASLLQAEDLPGQVGWHLTYWLDDPQYPGPKYQVELGPAPAQVETVINHRVVHGNQILAGVSGGVSVDPRPLVRRDAIELDSYGRLQAEHAGAAPEDLGDEDWWWD